MQIYIDRTTTKFNSVTVRFYVRREFDRYYRLQNKDKMAEYDREYRIRNKNKISTLKRDYYFRINDGSKKNYCVVSENDNFGILKSEEDMAICGQYQREYRVRNRDKLQEWNREYNNTKECSLESKREYNFRNKDRRRKYYLDYYIRKNYNPESYLARNDLFKSWRTPELVRKYFDSIAEQLHIADYYDWYRISRSQLRNLGGMQI
jgi:hypothetical protein